jgi:hypothetical protein
VPPELPALATLVAIIANAALALPKQQPGSISARLRDTTRGERHYLFGPPLVMGLLSTHLGVRVLQLLLVETVRGWELGVLVEPAAWLAEFLGEGRRREREREWQQSKSGLLWRYLKGEIGEAELRRRLHRQGHMLPPPPPPTATVASKEEFSIPRLRLDPLRPVGMIPMRPMEVILPEPPAPGGSPRQLKSIPAVPPADGLPVLQIQLLGRIRIVTGGEDLGPQLLHRPVQAFTFLYPLAREVRRPGDQMTRADWGAECFAGQDPEQQRRGVSNRLSHLRRHAPYLGERIISEGEYVSFDGRGCEIDVVRVFEIAQAVKQAGANLSDEQYQAALRAQEQASEEFMPGWDGIVQRAGGGRSGVGEVIAEVRSQLVAARSGILSTLAGVALSRRQLDEAICYLEYAVRARPDRGDLARRLADAYQRDGQLQRAAQLRKEYGLSEGA